MLKTGKTHWPSACDRGAEGDRLSAIQAGGAPVTDTFSANNWKLGLNRVAQTANAKATGNTVQFTDADTQLLTPGFNLAALATGTSALPNWANVNASQSGSFFPLNDAGARAGGRSCSTCSTR